MNEALEDDRKGLFSHEECVIQYFSFFTMIYLRDVEP